MIKKTAILGFLSSALIGWVLPLPFAVGILVGALLTVLNLRVFVRSMEVLFGKSRDEDTAVNRRSRSLWSFLFFVKMTVLIALTWFCIGIVEIDILGFAFGFSLFLPAMFWQMIAGPK